MVLILENPTTPPPYYVCLQYRAIRYYIATIQVRVEHILFNLDRVYYREFTSTTTPQPPPYVPQLLKAILGDMGSF